MRWQEVVEPRQRLWDSDLQAFGRIEEIEWPFSEVPIARSFSVVWSDGSASSYDHQDSIAHLDVIDFPDLSNPDSVEQWLATDGPEVP
jgi:hypothetical protein